MKEKEFPDIYDSNGRRFETEEEFLQYCDMKNYESQLDWYNAVLPFFENLDDVIARKKK